MTETPGLGQRILRETARFATLQVVGAVLVGLANLVLARLLEPRAFGVYAIGTFFVSLGAVLGDGGLGAALLRRRGDVRREEYQVTLGFLLGLGAVLGTALVVLAPRLAVAYHLTAAETRVIQAMAPLYLVGPLRAVPYIRLERELRFARIARIELAATVVRQGTAVTLAALAGSAWALAGASLVGALTQLVLAYLASPGWPGVAFSWATLRPLLGYGAQVQSLALAAFFKDNVSAVLLGRVLGPQAVGLFDFGVKYSQVPVLAVNALGRVQLPVYARLDARDPTLLGALRSATRTALLVGLPLLLVLAVGAPAIIPLVYTARWTGSTPVIYGLLANMAGGLLAGPLFVLLQGQGHAGRAVQIFTLWTIATWVLVALAWRSGLGAIAAVHSAVTVAVVAYLVAWAGRHLGQSLWGSFAGPFTAAGAALALAVALRVTTAGPARLHHPLAAAGAALATYVAVLLAIEGRQLVAEGAALLRVLRKDRGGAGGPA